MDPNRKRWNEGHQRLQQAFSRGDHVGGIELFLKQHAMVHSVEMSKSGGWSFEDEVLMELTEAQIRII